MLIKLVPDFIVEWLYFRAGLRFGDAVSYIYAGECVGFEDLLKSWEFWEAEYARRGFVTLAIDDFIEIGGYDAEVEGLGIKRATDEPVIFHAQQYRQKFLGQIKPVLNIADLTKPGAPIQVGTYNLPTTATTDRSDILK